MPKIVIIFLSISLNICSGCTKILDTLQNMGAIPNFCFKRLLKIGPYSSKATLKNVFLSKKLKSVLCT